MKKILFILLPLFILTACKKSVAEQVKEANKDGYSTLVSLKDSAGSEMLVKDSLIRLISLDNKTWNLDKVDCLYDGKFTDKSYSSIKNPSHVNIKFIKGKFYIQGKKMEKVYWEKPVLMFQDQSYNCSYLVLGDKPTFITSPDNDPGCSLDCWKNKTGFVFAISDKTNYCRSYDGDDMLNLQWNLNFDKEGNFVSADSFVVVKPYGVKIGINNLCTWLNNTHNAAIKQQERIIKKREKLLEAKKNPFVSMWLGVFDNDVARGIANQYDKENQ